VVYQELIIGEGNKVLTEIHLCKNLLTWFREGNGGDERKLEHTDVRRIFALFPGGKAQGR